MKYLASPRLRAYEAERAMKIGADIGPRNIAAEKARESALRSLRTILVDAGYYAGGRGADTVTREVEAQMGPNQEEVVSETVTQQAPAPRPQPQMPAQQGQAPVPQIPAAVAQPSPLLQAEINKLYGMPPV